MKYERIQEQEAQTWLIDDPVARREKALREFIRYPLIKKQMGLEHLDTSWMSVFDVGCGPLGGVSRVVNAKSITRFDPLRDEYARYFTQDFVVSMEAEKMDSLLGRADLIIVTNAMDHFRDPEHFLADLAEFVKPGAYFAHLHAINNAISHPHPAHVHNVNPGLFKEYLDQEFEQVWGLDFQHDGLVYGWLKQPAFSGLYRKVTGYKK